MIPFLRAKLPPDVCRLGLATRGDNALTAADVLQATDRGGALEYCAEARRAGRVRLLGLTSHQRPLAASVAREGLLDLLMIRYNAAHRGAETDVFPTTQALGMPVIVYTALRWGALPRGT